MKILILDDDSSIIIMLSELLQHKHTVEGTTSAESALEMLNHAVYDMIFVDYDMPEHDGLWFLKHANLPKTTATILFTGNLSRPLLSEMFRFGISGYLAKPVSIEQVEQQIDFYTHSGQYANYVASP